MQRDYKNYDYLTISVKTGQLERILECYNALGWREIKREDDREFIDMKYIALRRPHKIANKDRLQFLQVRMESLLNNVSHIFARKHAKSDAVLATLLTLALGLVALGLWLILGLRGDAGFIFGTVSLVLCAVAGACAAVSTTVMRKGEEHNASKKIVSQLKQLQTLIQEAVLLAPKIMDENHVAEEERTCLSQDAEVGQPAESALLGKEGQANVQSGEVRPNAQHAAQSVAQSVAQHAAQSGAQPAAQSVAQSVAQPAMQSDLSSEEENSSEEAV